MSQHPKLLDLQKMLRSMNNLAVAFSGGVDSTFLLKVASDILGESVVAVTASSSTFPAREFKEAISFTKSVGVRHIIIQSEELEVEGFANNPLDRCYLCKRELFTKILEIARDNQIDFIADGSNLDDNKDYRPGLKALSELKVVSPLREVGMTKEEIRILSREMNLPTWNKPAFACLASRIPYGQKITREKLSMVDRAEQFLLDKGFQQVRVRHHGDIARIEVPPQDRARFMNEELMDNIDEQFRKIGFAYTALDLKGYRTGSMNEPIVES